jgi:RNA polymerase sigma-70 factor (ECF subfamily)
MDERALILSLQAGDEAAFRQLFASYYSPLCEYTSRYTGDEDAEDIVQELFVHLWEQREDIVIVSSLKAYLFAAVRNRSLNAVKKRQDILQKQAEYGELLKDHIEEPDYYFIDELNALIEKSINDLPKKHRETFRLSRYEEMSNEEIARHSGVTVKAIEYRITQALRSLRRKLKDYL